MDSDKASDVGYARVKQFDVLGASAVPVCACSLPPAAPSTLSFILSLGATSPEPEFSHQPLTLYQSTDQTDQSPSLPLPPSLRLQQQSNRTAV